MKVIHTLDDKHIIVEDGALERARYVSDKLFWCRIHATFNDLFGYVKSVGTVQEMSSCYFDVSCKDVSRVNVNKLFCIFLTYDDLELCLLIIH